MPKATHFHVTHDTQNTDRKFRPEDEGVIEHEKQEFQESEQEKKADAMSEEEFIAEQDKQTEG